MGLAAIVCTVPAAALAADTNITQVVNYNGQTATMRLTRQNLRGPNFEVVRQDADGSFTPVTVTPERAYLGRVDEFPDAVASGILTESGVFRGLIIFDRGNTWYVKGNSVHRTLGWNLAKYFKYPTVEAVPGQVGTAITHLALAFDVSSEAYTNLGGNMQQALEEVEYAAALQRGLYMTNLLVRPYVARVIIRTSGAVDPYVGLNTGQFLNAVKTEWQTKQASVPRNLVAGIGGNVGGLAGGTGFGFDGGYFVQPWSPNGNTWGYLRHEMGHCFGMGHSDGNAPEGATINSGDGSNGNIYARMSTSEVKVGLDRRDARASEMFTEGTYDEVDLPPYACMDAAVYSYAPGSSLLIDVLANDHDANNDSLAILDFEPVTKLGARVQLSTGSGPGGRSQLALQRLADHGQEDYFTYRIKDSSGQIATAAVYVRSEKPSTKLAGTLIGSDGSWGGNAGWSKEKAVDGDFKTNYSARNATGDWVGLDLGSNNSKAVTKIRFCSRSGLESRMNGGVFQGSNTADFSSGVVTLHTVEGSPRSGGWTTLLPGNNQVFRYVRYMGPADSFCDIAEFEFWGGYPSAPNPPNGLTAAGASGGDIALSWIASPFATSYQIKRAAVRRGPYATIATGITGNSYTDKTTDFGRTYYYVISAVNPLGRSGNSYSVSVGPIPAPTSWWKFDAGSGTVAVDSTTAGNSGTLGGAAAWVSGLAGSGIQFDGSNSIVTCGTGPSVSGTNNFSVSAWIKTTATTEGVIIQQRDANGYNGEYILSLTPSGKVSFMVYGNNAYQFNFTTTKTVNDGAWHHIVATRNGLTGAIYINGDPTPAATANGSAIRNLSSTLGTVIGRDALDRNRNFNGTIDEVLVHKTTALDGLQIQALYKSYGRP